jgi:hypothetical protein
MCATSSSCVRSTRRWDGGAERWKLMYIQTPGIQGCRHRKGSPCADRRGRLRGDRAPQLHQVEVAGPPFVAGAAGFAQDGEIRVLSADLTLSGPQRSRGHR